MGDYDDKSDSLVGMNRYERETLALLLEIKSMLVAQNISKIDESASSEKEYSEALLSRAESIKRGYEMDYVNEYNNPDRTYALSKEAKEDVENILGMYDHLTRFVDENESDLRGSLDADSFNALKRRCSFVGIYVLDELDDYAQYLFRNGKFPHAKKSFDYAERNNGFYPVTMYHYQIHKVCYYEYLKLTYMFGSDLSLREVETITKEWKDTEGKDWVEPVPNP